MLASVAIFIPFTLTLHYLNSGYGVMHDKLCRTCLKIYVKKMSEYRASPRSGKFPVRISTDTSFVLKFALFWDFIQRRVVIHYRRFRTTYQSHLQRTKTPRSPSYSSSSSTFFLDFLNVEDGAETSVRDYHSTLCNITEECGSDLLCGGSLNSRVFYLT